MSEKPFYTRVALTGVGLIMFMGLLVVLATLVLSPDDVIFGLIVVIVPLVIGAVIYFLHPWGYILGILGGLFGLMVSSDGADLNFTTPQSFFDFGFVLFILIGAILILTGSVVGLISHFRGQTSTTGPAMLSTAVKGLVGVAFALGVISAILTVAGLGGVSDAEKAEASATLEAKDTEFSTDTLTASTSGTKILLKNSDPVLHTFTVEGLDIDVKMYPGAEQLYEIKGAKAGTYGYYCAVSGHKEDMNGAITVR